MSPVTVEFQAMSKTAAKVAMIGAGAMGFAMIELLAARGFTVWVYDPSPEARQRASMVGAHCLDSAGAVFEIGVPVISCVSSAKAFECTIEAALATHSRSTIDCIGPIIEASTLDGRVKERGRTQLAQAGITLLDCPVSGTSAQARNGDLTMFASGEDAALETCKPIFDAIASRLVQAGTFGTGMKLKLLANHLVTLNSIAAAEMLLLARRGGLDPLVALEALIQSAGNSRMLEVRGKLMLNHEYVPATGSIDILVKDGGMINEWAQQSQCFLPLFDRAYELVQRAETSGLGNHDLAVIHQYLLEHYSHYNSS